MVKGKVVGVIKTHNGGNEGEGITYCIGCSHPMYPLQWGQGIGGVLI